MAFTSRKQLLTNVTVSSSYTVLTLRVTRYIIDHPLCHGGGDGKCAECIFAARSRSARQAQQHWPAAFYGATPPLEEQLTFSAWIRQLVQFSISSRFQQEKPQRARRCERKQYHLYKYDVSRHRSRPGVHCCGGHCPIDDGLRWE